MRPHATASNAARATVAGNSFTRSLAMLALLWLATPLGQAQPADAPTRATPQGSTRTSTVIGSGTVRTETRAVTGFRAIVLRGPMNLVLREAGREGVEVRADDNLLPLVETRVVDRSALPTLEIGSPRDVSYSTRSEMTVTVDLITLKSLTLSGSGDARGDSLKADSLTLTLTGAGNLRLRQITADTLDLRLSGSGDLEAAGRASRLEVVLAGSGNAALHGLEADEVAVRSSGSGNAMVHARRALTVALSGSGDVSYVGDPAVTHSVRGSGDLKRR